MNIEQQRNYMKLALEESKRAMPECLPNPPVGCVLVRDGQILSTGYTKAPGKNHAEAEALSTIDNDESNIEAFVTLEPCSFHGKTPSCATALVEQKVSTVYVAMRDPDPRNNGKGIEILRQAGIEVVENVCAERVSGFLSSYLQGGLSRNLRGQIT